MFLGERIKEKKLKPDLAIPVFDSGYPAAKGVARELKIPLVDAITTSHYIGRTFIKPGQQNREAAVGGKHNVVSDEVFGKKVVVVDDSGVRLTTSIVLAKALKKAGAEEIYFAFASPPVIKQCDLGIDMRSKNELPAAKYVNKSLSIIEKEISKIIKANEVIYLSIDKTAEAMGGMKEEFYYTPFGGPHPIRDNQTPIPKMKKKLSKKPKLSIFISGSGTNLQQIINAIESNYLDAEIIDVLSNKNDAYGLIRAKKHELRSTVIPYTEKLSNKSARSTYSKKLIEHIKRTKPDLIILAGWLMVLDDNFLQELQSMEIPVINLHPALMTPILDETIQTSKGRIPVLRGWGMNVIKPPFENKLLLSGITVHQILPKNKYDVGPIIMKAEVHRKPDDNLASWEKKIHDTEHMLLPTAVKRVLHVMKNGIDISKGEYAW
jgi:formyltetrahydrofolate-dependent phosphoribosylglycinamide formyltransferase